MDRRKFIVAGGAIAVSSPALFSGDASAAAAVKVYEYTFLKSSDAKPAALLRFIKANWFAMDKIAVEKGLMVNYSVFEVADEPNWNVAVAVGYPKEEGYQAIAEDFVKIRQRHKKVLIDGKDLKDLGEIVASRKFYPRTA